VLEIEGVEFWFHWQLNVSCHKNCKKTKNICTHPMTSLGILIFNARIIVMPLYHKKSTKLNEVSTSCERYWFLLEL
jgi:hypothetical protein